MIPVELAFEHKGYATPDAAIAAAKNDPAQPTARHDGLLFSGRTFVDAWGGAGEWVLEFSGNLWLRVFIDGVRVAWAVERVKPPRSAVDGPIIMEWPDGGTSCLDVEALAADRRGATFWHFWVNEGGFHVYLRRKPILCFSAARRRDTGQIILWVWEDD
jgi:hypothetical protein